MNTLASAQTRTAARTQGTVRIVGTGLLGTSIGLALRELGVDVVLANRSPSALALAVDYGAGRVASPDDAPALIVVAVSPDVTAALVAEELEAFPEAIVTDVASVKLELLNTLRERGVDLDRYVGSHPMAGRERGGAIMARADLFIGRPWVISTDATPQAQARVEALALDVQATPVRLSAAEHDQSVALVSHLPQVVSSLLAARLTGNEAALRLAGQGLRDTTRIAASDPELWVQILSANHKPVASLLSELRDDLNDVLAALENPDAAGAQRQIASTLAAGNRGAASIPGKHGSAELFTTIIVAIDDKPGELARLLTEIGELGINLEDMRMEHSPGAQVGFVEIAVLPSVAEHATTDLIERGWSLV